MRRSALGLVVLAALTIVSCHVPPDKLTDRARLHRPCSRRFWIMLIPMGLTRVFEASLISRTPVIIIRTENEKPDWHGRLNAWIAAWNQGGLSTGGTIRGQIPLATIDGDTLREFRALVFGVVDRADDLAKAGFTWSTEERIRAEGSSCFGPTICASTSARRRRFCSSYVIAITRRNTQNS